MERDKFIQGYLGVVEKKLAKHLPEEGTEEYLLSEAEVIVITHQRTMREALLLGGRL